MKAIHFGAGNIGRGFVGLLLHEAGYEVVFADVNAALIDALQSAPSYRVFEVGGESSVHVVDSFRAINSDTQSDQLATEIATADIVTTAVGPNILKFIAPAIAAGLVRRRATLPPLPVIACENAINATDRLAEHVLSHVLSADRDAVTARVVFANTAVDRIVPGQSPDAGIDVTVETFAEWVIERGGFAGAVPDIAGATFVDNLEPFIERKLFTVNTGHATIAYFGHLAGAATISEALELSVVRDAARRVLEETSALLVAKHGLDSHAQRAYREKILTRFENPALQDTVVRVGREPMRKLSRFERFIGPAAELAEGGTNPVALLEAIRAAFRFDVPGDSQSVELQRMLAGEAAPRITEVVCGLDGGHPLFEAVTREIAAAQRVRH
ncbi:mannitol-1-phosphate 5-dehydrogenase [Cryobacterium luteum]|uniref:Mannitol-1-phosphate 5-dehydrogenase n=1 Tax=Cryobacterium luteum TaxID=1424661 RepID=A0A1H8C4T3_9MICO|nr:mannitol-1-phosphate 5-dehydrogenase [Cryobacterium luteum]TFB89249.1 mannitol-1-phosphate 5-dehydrogenase [Cryobacterium luteum]SEM90070.1 D-mannitol 1-phosphate 5-dehydrogenase [Cryobacterium luteum]